MADEGDETQRVRPEKVEYHHIKSQDFRVLHIDGGSGGISPRGYCNISLYSERKVIPRVTVRDISEQGDVGPEHTTDTLVKEPKLGVVREIGVSLLFDEQTAIEIRDWLNRRIDEFNQMKAAESKSTKLGDKNAR